jgi:diacylglycerol kinase
MNKFTQDIPFLLMFIPLVLECNNSISKLVDSLGTNYHTLIENAIDIII